MAKLKACSSSIQVDPNGKGLPSTCSQVRAFISSRWTIERVPSSVDLSCCIAVFILPRSSWLWEHQNALNSPAVQSFPIPPASTVPSLLQPLKCRRRFQVVRTSPTPIPAGAARDVHRLSAPRFRRSCSGATVKAEIDDQARLTRDGAASSLAPDVRFRQIPEVLPLVFRQLFVPFPGGSIVVCAGVGACSGQELLGRYGLSECPSKANCKTRVPATGTGRGERGRRE